MSFIAPTDKTTGTVITAAHWNQDVVENVNAAFPDAVSAPSWTPTLEATSVNPPITSVAGREWAMGALQFVWARWELSGGAGEGGSGTFFVTLPTPASGVAATQVVGEWLGGDATASANNDSGPVVIASGLTTVRFRVDGTTQIDESKPFSWATGDTLSFQAVYPIA
jgi:hypothetical protein